MADLETPRSPSVQSFASSDTVSVAFTSIPGSPTMSSASDEAATRATHEAPVVPAQAHRFYLDDGNMKLKLEDGTFYNVHRHFFGRHAPRFAELYLRGEQPDILEIHDVSSIDFERFLSIIYPNELGVCDIRTVDEWTSVLRLASMWSVPSLRQVAIRETEPNATPIDKIVLAREFGLGEAWLLPAFVALCRSSEPLEYEDAERLGLRTVVEIGRIKSRSGESYDLEAAVRASDVFLSPGTDVMVPLVAVSEPSTRNPSLSPSSTPVVDHGPRLPLIDTHVITARCTDQLDTNGDLSYMALLASERAEEEALKSSHSTPCYVFYDYHLVILRIAYRLISETSIAALRHRRWRELCLRRNGYPLGQHATADRLEADVSWEVRPSYQDQTLYELCPRIVQYICNRLSWAMASRWEDGHPPWSTVTVRVTQDESSQYSVVASCILDIKVLLKREGIPFAQDAEHADCIRVMIPSPSRDWFIPDDL